MTKDEAMHFLVVFFHSRLHAGSAGSKNKVKEILKEFPDITIAELVEKYVDMHYKASQDLCFPNPLDLSPLDTYYESVSNGC